MSHRPVWAVNTTLGRGEGEHVVRPPAAGADGADGLPGILLSALPGLSAFPRQLCGGLRVPEWSVLVGVEPPRQRSACLCYGRLRTAEDLAHSAPREAAAGSPNRLMPMTITTAPTARPIAGRAVVSGIAPVPSRAGADAELRSQLVFAPYDVPPSRRKLGLGHRRFGLLQQLCEGPAIGGRYKAHRSEQPTRSPKEGGT